jgi:hypothetical protein
MRLRSAASDGEASCQSRMMRPTSRASYAAVISREGADRSTTNSTGEVNIALSVVAPFFDFGHQNIGKVFPSRVRQ